MLCRNQHVLFYVPSYFWHEACFSKSMPRLFQHASNTKESTALPWLRVFDLLTSVFLSQALNQKTFRRSVRRSLDLSVCVCRREGRERGGFVNELFAARPAEKQQNRRGLVWFGSDLKSNLSWTLPGPVYERSWVEENIICAIGR